jgi:hypothetical protein
MKAKTVSPSKQKAGSPAKKKPLSPAKRKAASVTKKKAAAAPAKKNKPLSSPTGKPVPLAKKKLELHDQFMQFAASAFKDKRTAYFVLDTERTKEGAYIMCVAIEGESGFYKMDWAWHCSFTRAKAQTALMNKKLGLNEEEVNKIIISTMGPAIRQEKKRR